MASNFGFEHLSPSENGWDPFSAKKGRHPPPPPHTRKGLKALLLIMNYYFFLETGSFTVWRPFLRRLSSAAKYFLQRNPVRIESIELGRAMGQKKRTFSQGTYSIKRIGNKKEGVIWTPEHRCAFGHGRLHPISQSPSGQF